VNFKRLRPLHGQGHSAKVRMSAYHIWQQQFALQVLHLVYSALISWKKILIKKYSVKITMFYENQVKNLPYSCS